MKTTTEGGIKSTPGGGSSPNPRIRMERPRLFLALSLAAGVAIILMVMHFYGFTRTMSLWSINTYGMKFLDLRLITDTPQSIRQGYDPAVQNPGDPLQRIFNYPQIWYLILKSGINEKWTAPLGIVIIALFLVSVCVFPGRLTPLSVGLLLLAMASPAVMLGLARVNVDLLIFALMTLSLGLVTAQAVWALAVLEKRLGEKAFGDAARKGAQYLVTKREAEMHWAEAPTDPWLGAALRELSTPFADASCVAYAKRMADHTVKRQKTVGDPDMVGLYEGDREGSTAGTALGVTLLGQALDFTSPAPDARKQYAASMRAAIRFLHLNEIRANNSFFLVSPERAYGFIRSGTFDTDVDLATTAACIESLLWMDRVEKIK